MRNKLNITPTVTLHPNAIILNRVNPNPMQVADVRDSSLREVGQVPAKEMLGGQVSGSHSSV